MFDRRNPLWFQPDEVPEMTDAEYDNRADLESLELLAEAHELALDQKPEEDYFTELGKAWAEVMK